jgi:hypothetical protein
MPNGSVSTLALGGSGRMRSWLRATRQSAACALLLVACVYDPDQRCDGGQVLYESDFPRCICAPGSAATAEGCVPCADNEVAAATGCDCAEGFARPSDGATCEAVPMGQGVACDEASAACVDPDYNHCQIVSGTSGYCTNTGCTGASDCAGGYACDTTASPSFCRRPPLGAGQSCSADSDCAGTEASYCDTFVTHTCLVVGCSLAPDNCFAGTECCDLSAFGVPRPLCVAQGACAP